MRGQGTDIAEIAGRVHNSRSEMPLPETIHENAGRERIARVANPAGKAQARIRFYAIRGGRQGAFAARGAFPTRRKSA